MEAVLRSIPTSHVSTAEPIQWPPPFSLVRLCESGDAFAHACRIAPERGAGTLVYVGRFDLAEFAVVLAPAEPLITARRAFYAGMVALTDALRAYAPPANASAGQLTESFARHLMRAIDSWQVDGFDSVARDYLGRMPCERQAVHLGGPGW